MPPVVAVLGPQRVRGAVSGRTKIALETSAPTLFFRQRNPSRCQIVVVSAAEFIV